MLPVRAEPPFNSANFTLACTFHSLSRSCFCAILCNSKLIPSAGVTITCQSIKLRGTQTHKSSCAYADHICAQNKADCVHYSWGQDRLHKPVRLVDFADISRRGKEQEVNDVFKQLKVRQCLRTSFTSCTLPLRLMSAASLSALLSTVHSSRDTGIIAAKGVHARDMEWICT